MSTARVGDINLEYYVEGAGPPLLMIMGMGGQAASWGEPFLAQLRPHFRIIRFSNRGTGLSDKPNADVSIRTMADDAAGLLDALGIEKAHMLGISLGGMSAQELVLNHPQRVQGLVLGCTNCGPLHSVAPPAETLAKLGQITSLPVQERIRQFWLLTVSPEFMVSGKEFLDGIIEVHMAAPTPMETFGRQFAAATALDTYGRLPQIKSPTLIIHGDRDALIPVANAGVLHKQIAGSQLHVIPGAGHCFFWEKPDESAKAAIEFLSKLPVAA